MAKSTPKAIVASVYAKLLTRYPIHNTFFTDGSKTDPDTERTIYSIEQDFNTFSPYHPLSQYFQPSCTLLNYAWRSQLMITLSF